MQDSPLAAHRVHVGVTLSHRRLPRTQALQLFCRDAAAAAAAADAVVVAPRSARRTWCELKAPLSMARRSASVVESGG